MIDSITRSSIAILERTIVSQIDVLINQAADSTKPLSDVLRQVKIVSARIQDAKLSEWATKELNGYSGDDILPEYRKSRELTAIGNWSGPFGSGIKNAKISLVGLPNEFVDGLTNVEFHYPVAELEALSQSEDALGVLWDPVSIDQYNTYVSSNQGGVGYEHMILIGARSLISKAFIFGLLDSIRNNVLDFALALSAAAPRIGDSDGPTVNDPKVLGVVQNFHVTIYGDGANVANGDGLYQQSTVTKNDSQALISAACQLGLSREDAQDFLRDIVADGNVEGERTRSFIRRLEGGAITVAGNTTASMVATGLIELAGQFLGG